VLRNESGRSTPDGRYGIGDSLPRRASCSPTERDDRHLYFQLNACPYCFDSHGFFLTVQGATIVTVKAVAANKLDEAEISMAEQELLRFTGKVNSESFKIDDDDVQRLRDLHWREEQIAEAVHVAALMRLCNRIANTFGLPSQGFLKLE
jgi:alkylhydroperoxidase family enzyme